jgi:hypothetical protein
MATYSSREIHSGTNPFPLYMTVSKDIKGTVTGDTEGLYLIYLFDDLMAQPFQLRLIALFHKK